MNKPICVDLSKYTTAERALMHPAIVRKLISFGYRDGYVIENTELGSEFIYIGHDGMIISGARSCITHEHITFGVDEFMALDTAPQEGGEEKKESCEFKPFDRVLGRDETNEVWTPDIFSFMDTDYDYPYICLKTSWGYCIPYEGNEHLAGTNSNP